MSTKNKKNIHIDSLDADFAFYYNKAYFEL